MSQLPFPPRHDFRALRQRVAIEDVLAARGLRLHRQGDRLTGPCPIHGGDNPTAFVVNCRKNVWYCFSQCGRGGDVLELVRLLDRVSICDAATAVSTMGPSISPPPAPRRPPGFRPFELSLYLDPASPWLQAKGIQPATAQAFEAGLWRGPGMLSGCVAVRLHSPSGAPWGYAGRRLEPSRGKWVFPTSFPKGEMLYGLHRVDPTSPRLVVVECPWGVMRLSQVGIPAVALLGTTLSARQAELLAQREQVVLMLDGDAAGRRGAREAAARLEMSVDVAIVRLPTGADPDDLPDPALLDLLG